MAKILISDCLLGTTCRYDGKAKPNRAVVSLSQRLGFIRVCPECDGGLTCPREPSELVAQRVLARDGCDVTEQFYAGAALAVQKAKENHVGLAILKAKSPSCGKGHIYDGTFTGTLVEGNGVTVNALRRAGIIVIDESFIEKHSQEIEISGLKNDRLVVLLVKLAEKYGEV